MDNTTLKWSAILTRSERGFYGLSWTPSNNPYLPLAAVLAALREVKAEVLAVTAMPVVDMSKRGQG